MCINKKIILFMIVAMFLCNVCLASNKIIKRDGWYYFNEKKYGMIPLSVIKEKSEQAYEIQRKAWDNYGTGSLYAIYLGIPVSIFSVVQNLSYSKNSDWSLAMVGSGLILIGYFYLEDSEKLQEKAVEMYNKALEEKDDFKSSLEVSEKGEPTLLMSYAF